MKINQPIHEAPQPGVQGLRMVLDPIVATHDEFAVVRSLGPVEAWTRVAVLIDRPGGILETKGVLAAEFVQLLRIKLKFRPVRLSESNASLDVNPDPQ